MAAANADPGTPDQDVIRIVPVVHGDFLALRHVCVVPMETVTGRLGFVYVTLDTMGPTVIKCVEMDTGEFGVAMFVTVGERPVTRSQGSACVPLGK